VSVVDWSVAVGQSRGLFNPYRHWAGSWVGSWDINVIAAALALRHMIISTHIIFLKHNPAKFEAEIQALASELGAVRMAREARQRAPLLTRPCAVRHDWDFGQRAVSDMVSKVDLGTPLVLPRPRSHTLRCVRCRCVCRALRADSSARLGEEIWYNKDSKLSGPMPLGGRAEVVAFLMQEAIQNQAQIFLINHTPL
jgi:hypothetical protein